MFAKRGKTKGSRIREKGAHYVPLIREVIRQTERRVFNDETVPASEKIFGIFETHTDIIIKGKRDIQYGHKLNLSSGKSGLILDIVIEEGNSADTGRFLPMLERHIANYGYAPQQVAVDGGYASKDNLREAKSCSVEDVAFHKKRGIKIEDRVKSPWIYRPPRNFRAGIEAGISCLKRAYGLSRCTWKGLEHFKLTCGLQWLHTIWRLSPGESPLNKGCGNRACELEGSGVIVQKIKNTELPCQD